MTNLIHMRSSMFSLGIRGLKRGTSVTLLFFSVTLSLLMLLLMRPCPIILLCLSLRTLVTTSLPMFCRRCLVHRRSHGRFMFVERNFLLLSCLLHHLQLSLVALLPIVVSAPIDPNSLFIALSKVKLSCTSNPIA